MALNLADLKESNEFLNVLLDNINSAVLIIDDDLRIRQFNESLVKIFGKNGQKVAGEKCGEALGCVFAEVENVSCGNTSHCERCRLRKAVLKTFRSKRSLDRQMLARKFYVDTVPVLKFLEYTTRYIRFGGQEFTLVIMDDVTEKETGKQALIRKQKQIELDLRSAEGIQRTLLPSADLEFDRIEAAWQFLPCARIGGDIFNILSLGEGRTACYMMDASGHGVHSALVAVSVSHLLDPVSSRLPLASPSSVCRELDAQFPLERFNSFFSVIYMIFDPRAGTLSWCNAGHPPAVIVRRSGEIELLKASGPIIGLGGMLPHVETTRRIGAGDRVFLYTDGLIERRNRQGVLFGLEGLLAGIEKTREKPLSDVLSELVRIAMEYGEETDPADDISILGLEIK